MLSYIYFNMLFTFVVFTIIICKLLIIFSNLENLLNANILVFKQLRYYSPELFFNYQRKIITHRLQKSSINLSKVIISQCIYQLSIINNQFLVNLPLCCSIKFFLKLSYYSNLSIALIL